MIEIARIAAFDDNYIWLLHEPVSGETVVVDPGVAEPVLAEATRRGWRIGQIWNTHWHADHTGGNAAIKAATGCTISGPAAEAARIPTLDRMLGEGDAVRIGGTEAAVLDVPGHTAGHIAFHLAQAEAAFVGDTLFVMGCGRLFEGTAGQMWRSLRRLTELPPETRLYCAHEYTLGNARFALTAEPDNAAIAVRARTVEQMRQRDEATVPTTVAYERETNPFVRAFSAEALGQLRAAKDGFRG